MDRAERPERRPVTVKGGMGDVSSRESNDLRISRAAKRAERCRLQRRVGRLPFQLIEPSVQVIKVRLISVKLFLSCGSI